MYVWWVDENGKNRRKQLNLQVMTSDITLQNI